MRINRIAALACGLFVGGGSASSAQEAIYFKTWKHTEMQFMALPAMDRLSLHNRCVAAAMYALMDTEYSERQVASVYFFHYARAEDVLRSIPYGQRKQFDHDAGSVQENAKIYRSLGWTNVLEATITKEMKPCIEVAGH
jgi:hypothetical protein